MSEARKPRNVTKRLGRPPDTAIPLCAHPDQNGVSYLAAEDWFQTQTRQWFSLRAACRRATIILGEDYDAVDPRFPGFERPADAAARRNSERIRHKNARGTVELILRDRTGGRGKDWSADADNLRKAFMRARSPADVEWLRHAMTAWILYLDPRGAAPRFRQDIRVLRGRCEHETHAQEFWARMWRIGPLLVEKGLRPPP